jgi:hypothetical protein
MIELHSINWITGFMAGLEYEELDENQYLILNLGIIQIIWVW